MATKKTHCKYGHEKTPENTGWGGRCKECGKRQMRKQRWGDPDYITPSDVRVDRQRESMMKNKTAQPHTYKKYYQRHEHRVVAEQMLGRPLVKGEIVHHINGDKHDNRPENLEVITQSEHAKMHFANGEFNRTNIGRTLSRTDVLRIRELWSTGKYKQKEIGAMYGISQGYISAVVLKKIWRDA